MKSRMAFRLALFHFTMTHSKGKDQGNEHLYSEYSTDLRNIVLQRKKVVIIYNSSELGKQVLL